MKSSIVSLAVLALALAGCPGSTVSPADDTGGALDASTMDVPTSIDGGGSDGGTIDGGTIDGGSGDDTGSAGDDAGAMADGGAADAGGTSLDVGVPADGGRDAGTSCTSNGDCRGGTYCAKPVGMCGGSGMCAAIPRACPDVYAPVCGCDGNTYGNGCEAASAAMNIRDTGECDPRSCDMRPSASCCYDDADCAGGGSVRGRCVNERCEDGIQGTCVGGLGAGQCWEDSDCPDDPEGRPQRCTGQSICPCGALCIIADHPGTCSARL